MVWHRLTWETDLNVVRNILGSDTANEIPDFDPGEAILMTDWDDAVERVQFRRKKTHDAGATPGLESYERPDLKSVGTELIREIEGDTGGFDVNEVEPSSNHAETDIPEPPDETVDELDRAVEGFGLDDGVAESGPDVDGDEQRVAGEVEEGEIDAEAHGGANGLEDQDGPEYQNGLDDPGGLDDPDELESQLYAERRRRTILEDEIAELRTILENADASTFDPDAVTSPPANERPVRISPPTPPRRPPNREGVAGNMVEFGEMVIYMMKSLWYRVRLAKYNYL